MRTMALQHSLTMTSPETPESDIDMVKRHVLNAEQRVVAQRKMIALLAARRLPMKQAQDLLHLFEATWQAHVNHLAALEEVERRRLFPRRSGERVGPRSRL
jgi:hypothetical protein